MFKETYETDHPIQALLRMGKTELHVNDMLPRWITPVEEVDVVPDLVGGHEVRLVQHVRVILDRPLEAILPAS